jgi:hypothetical protein
MGTQAWAAEKGTAPTPGTGSGLAHLGAALEGTGRIATTEVQPARVDVGAATPDDPARGPRPDAQRADESGAQAAAEQQAAGFDPRVDLEFDKAQPSLDACRVEVARRRRVPATEIAAGTVTLRWTIEPDGRVRDAEALAVTDTQLDVAACAKRVISGWVFAKPRRGAVTVQRTHTFR